MKRLLLLLVLVLLMTGCNTEQPPQTTAETQETTQDTQTTQPAVEDPGLYVPRSLEERLTDGAVKAYALEDGFSLGLVPMGEDLLLVSGRDSQTTLTVLTGANCAVAYKRTVNQIIRPDEGSMRVHADGIVYYDGVSNSIIKMSPALQQTQQLFLPQEILGTPIIGEDLTSVYYCTEDRIHVLNMDTGISRLLRQQECQRQTLDGVYFSDTVLQTTVTEENDSSYTCFLSTQTGELLGMDAQLLNMEVCQDRYFLSRMEGCLEEYLFGTTQGQLLAWQPEAHDYIWAVPELNGVVAMNGLEMGTAVAFYDLESGKRTAYTELPLVFGIYHVLADPTENCVWMIAYDEDTQLDMLYRWEIGLSAVSDEGLYTGQRYTRNAPDTDGLAQLQELVQSLEKKHGVKIYIGEDVIQPQDYTLTTEFRPEAFRYGLEQMDKALSAYPEGLLKKAVRTTASRVLRISLVRDISDGMTGVQYWLESDAYIALEIGDSLEQSLYHEVSHVLDNYIIAYSYAYDDWEELTPGRFDYDYNYQDYKTRQDSPYLEGEDRAFIDSYSMSYPKEDRARILEYAMMPGNAELFTSETMQRKLLQICQGIRESFEYEKYEGTFLWEQYLEESLAYVKKKK